MKRFRWLFVVIIVAALTTAGFFVYRSRSSAAATASAAKSSTFTQVVDVRQGNLSASLTVVGQVDAEQSADLTFERMSGTTKLLTLDVKTGNTVKAGQVLATIDPASYQQALDQARSNLQAAEEKLKDLQTPVTDLARAKSDLAIVKADSDLTQARADLAERQAPDLSRLQVNLTNAQDSLVVAQLQQTLADHDATAKSERDLLYAVDWHQRRINDLQTLVARGKANVEQTQLLDKERETLSQAQADLARVSAQRQLGQAGAAAAAAKAETTLADARTALTEAQAGSDPSTSSGLALAKARLAVQQAEVALATARDDRANLDAGPDAAALTAAQADYDKKKLVVADAEAALTGTNLTAPFAGTVLRTYVIAGNQIGTNTRIATVADMKALQVAASVDETTIRRVSAGQSATITFDAFPGRSFRGKVVSVPLQGALQGGVMVYEVPVSLTGVEGLALLVGMTANVKVDLGQATNALLVPAMAVVRSSGTTQVLVPNALDAKAAPELVPVEVGLSDGVNTQIVKGLNLGDKVVVQMTSAQSNSFNFGAMLGGGPVQIQQGGAQQGNRQPNR